MYNLEPKISGLFEDQRSVIPDKFNVLTTHIMSRGGMIIKLPMALTIKVLHVKVIGPIWMLEVVDTASLSVSYLLI